MDIDRLISARAKAIDASGIRRVFDLAAGIKDPINLSIGQPDFPVPDQLKRAAIDAIVGDQSGYTQTQGIPALRQKLGAHLAADVGWSCDLRPLTAGADAGRPGLMVTAGTSGGILLAMMAVLDPGDEVIFADPYFVMYPHAARMIGAVPVMCDTYPDFRLTASRVEPLITPRTRMVLLNSPGNPSGTVASGNDCAELLDLCRRWNVLLVSDEIYDEFTYSNAVEEVSGADLAIKGINPGRRCPSPARFSGSENDVLLVRGFGKTYGLTGWRLGYAAGPRRIIEEMSKLQQYTYVCAPAPLQHGVCGAFEVDMSRHIAEYERRRDFVVERLRAVTELAAPGGAFYAFPMVPSHLGLSAADFIMKCIERSLLVIPGNVFSQRDTHFRISFATSERNLERGLDVLVDLMRR